MFVSVSTAKDKTAVRAERKFRLNCVLQCAAHDFAYCSDRFVRFIADVAC